MPLACTRSSGYKRLPVSLTGRSRKAHPRSVNILPSLLYISGAKIRFFLRFKDLVSKWTGISPRGRLQPPPCPKTRSDALRHTLPCSDTPYSAATYHTQRQHALAARHRTSPRAKHSPGVARPPNALHLTPFKRPSPRTFQTTNRPALSRIIPPRPLAQLIHGRAKPLPWFPCCQQPVALPNPKRPSDLLRNDHAPKLVNSAHNPRCPQCSHPP